MTVARLKERMDRRFNAVDKRLDSLSEKLDAIQLGLTREYRHHGKVLDEHEKRIKDLETGSSPMAG